MTNQQTGADIDEDQELAASLHRVLATLINIRPDRRPLPPERIQERLELVQWLRGELTAVEALLTTEQDRSRRGPAPLAGGTPTR